MATSDEPRSWKPKDVVYRHSADDLRHWSERFGVSEDELRRAISEVGPRTAGGYERFTERTSAAWRSARFRFDRLAD
jgi:hypothetical protein